MRDILKFSRYFKKAEISAKAGINYKKLMMHLSCNLECRIRDGVKGIHLTVNRKGRPTGRAFLEMEHEEDVSKALEKHRQYLGPRYVEGSSSSQAKIEM